MTTKMIMILSSNDNSEWEKNSIESCLDFEIFQSSLCNSDDGEGGNSNDK